MKTKLKFGEKTLIMGILNLTPDSFSDGGKFNDPQKALKRVREMEEDGADIIDLGAESTGPDSKSVSEKEELGRLIPILRLIRKNTSLPISIDTCKSAVAKASLDEGADLINDVTALRHDKNMAEIVAEYDCPIVLMYSKDNTPRTSRKKKRYTDIINSIKIFLQKRINFAKSRGISQKNIIIDPGMGAFISAIPKYSFEIIARLRELKTLRLPILIGFSRKSFLAGSMPERDIKGQAMSAIAYLNGASIIRTHDVKATRLTLNQML